MKSRNGLSLKHGALVVAFIQSVPYPVSANVVRDRLWDSWGKNAPTCREIGTFMNLHPNMARTEKASGPAEYLWSE